MKIQITAAALTALLAVLPAWSQNLGTGSAGNVTPANSGASSSGLSSGASSANAAGTRGNVSGLTINPYQTTLGFYNPYIGSGTTIHYPGFGVPKQTTGNFYSVASGNCNLPMWRAPSGYYYPWAPRPSGFRYDYYPVPVLVFDKASEAPAPAIPPMAVSFSDMEKFLEEVRRDGKISETDYNGMVRRVRDLRSKERSLRISAGGSLDPADEASLRRDLDKVGEELTWRLNR